MVSPGDRYWLDADDVTQGKKLPWVDWKVCPADLRKYKYWKDLQGKEVVVKGYSFKHLGKIVVHPVDVSKSGPGLIVPPEFLIPVLEIIDGDDDNDELVCNCDIFLLMSVGCQCGVFRKEQALKNTPIKEKSDEILNPW